MKTAPKLALGFSVSIFTTLIILGVVAVFWGLVEYNKAGPLAEAKLIDIPSGSSNVKIAQILQNEGVFDDEKDMLLFKISGRLTGASSKLKAGEYEVPAGISIAGALELLEDGKTFARRVTLREGLTSYEIVRLLNGVEELTGDVKAIPAEGSLLPETYDYRLEEERGAILTRMAEAMEEAKEALWPTRVEGLPFKTLEEAIVLASIVEKETGVAEERRRVAGVFINRLRRGIPLQTDPTVIYAITKGKHKNEGKGPLGRRLLLKDLEVNSPYNTYKNAGLPPGPIANPGRASIEAVLNPESHDYIYFVADGTGGHVFAKTLKEHNNNVAKWRKIRRAKK